MSKRVKTREKFLNTETAEEKMREQFQVDSVFSVFSVFSVLEALSFV